MASSARTIWTWFGEPRPTWSVAVGVAGSRKKRKLLHSLEDIFVKPSFLVCFIITERQKRELLFSLQERKGLKKALFFTLSKETYETLRRRAFKYELSIQKTVRRIIEEAVKNEPNA